MALTFSSLSCTKALIDIPISAFTITAHTTKKSLTDFPFYSSAQTVSSSPNSSSTSLSSFTCFASAKISSAFS